MQIKSYTVLTCTEENNLESRVLAYLEHGWMPLGGVSMTYAKRPPREWFWDSGEFGEPRLIYTQAMGHPDPQAFDPELHDPASAPVLTAEGERLQKTAELAARMEKIWDDYQRCVKNYTHP
jgi:hypothetical protein